jgi:hypothetical protein
MQQTKDTCIYAATPCHGLANNMDTTTVMVDQYLYTEGFMILVINKMTKKNTHTQIS